MKEKITVIVLSTVRHSDRHNVTGVFTRERGRMALLTPAGTSKASRQAASCFQPLSVVEAQVNVSATRELHIPTGVARAAIWRTIYYEPLKMAIAMFLSEFLSRLLREAPADHTLWDFVMQSVSLLDELDNETAIANFHISFLVGLMRITGIFPDLSGYSYGMEFDMKSGRMVLPFSMQGGLRGLRIDADKAAFIPKLSRMNYANSHRFRLSGRERSEILDDIIHYFGCHFPGCDRIKSLDIFRELFS